MSTLTETALFSKKALVWVLIGGAVLVGLLLLWIFGRIIYNMIVPPKPVPAFVAYGKIPKLDLSGGVSRTNDIEFSIETISGDLPQLPNSLKIFAIEQEESSFGAIDDIKNRAKSLDFENEPELLQGNVVRFIQNDKLNKTLTINVSTSNFNLTTDFRNNQEIISTEPKSDENAMDMVTSFLQSIGINLNAFPSSTADILYFRIDGTSLTEVEAVAGSNLVQVFFHRAPIDEIPVISPKKDEAPIKALISSREIVDLIVNKQQVQYHDFSTYPLKGVAQAFEEITTGRGALNVDFKPSVFPIRKVTLAYLETFEVQQYLQPVYLFETDNNVYAYVSAVSENWITN